MCKKSWLIKILAIAVIISFVDSCSGVRKILPNRPDRDFRFGDEVSPEFKQGWADGCEGGMSAGSNTFYKAFYDSAKVDGYKMANSNDYKTAWSNAFWYCFRADYVKQKSSIWGSTFSGYR